MRPDVIRLNRIVFSAHHGVSQEERKGLTRIEVDVEMHTDISSASRTDDLHRTVDYSEVLDSVRDIVMGPSCSLLETLAERIANKVLAHPRCSATVVRVRKVRPPVAEFVENAELEIFREKQSG